MHDLVQQLINGLSNGATYALIALGYTMVYGVLRLINFAHGEVYMMGAVTGFHLARWVAPMHHPLWLKLVLVFGGAVLICCLLGFLIEFLAYRPLRSRPRIVSLITAIGVSLLLQNLAQMPWIFGPTPRGYPALIEDRALFTFFVGDSPDPVRISTLDALCLGLSLFIMVILTWIVLGTRSGLALRAVSHRFDTSSLMGINVNRIVSFTFMLGSSLAAVAGVVNAMRYDVKADMGVLPGLKAFVAAVLGGIGSIPGALVGGLLIGLIETAVKHFLHGTNTGYADAVAFVVLILILLVKPTGIFGRQVAEKV